MWERFTERARRLVFQAQREAARFHGSIVGTEHLLLALIHESDSVACRILDRMGISLERIRQEISRQVPVVTGPEVLPDAEYTLSPRAKRVIDLAYDEARQLSNNYIGTEHLLLGLMREADGLAGLVLAQVGVDLDRTRREVMALQDNDSGIASTPPPPASPSRSASDFTPPVRSSSSVSVMTTTAATILFEREFRKLSVEQRQALQTDSLALSELPRVFYVILKVMMEAWDTQEIVIPESNGRVRVQPTREEGKPGYAVQTDVALLTTLLVKDE